MKASDFLLDAGYDVAIENGDFVAGLSDEQHQELLLLTAQGEWRQSPLTGINLLRYQSGPMDAQRRAALQREGTLQLERDGYRVYTFLVSAAAELTLNAERP
ncbi:hypothetical protein [Hymenobacter sp. YC55]|uniref:hypothetical protein n=1 Tax=Hymenobacter sp. YC55 TaxID=3034019 RepID=UPI0023F7E52E|nr:hypothetical protein [Hymenobacter sp. YC55]MDF7809905.1 hypothetical protein [Hymenobacter sp. YC55]